MNEPKENGHISSNHHQSTAQTDDELIHGLPIDSSNLDNTMSMKKTFSIFGILIVAGLVSGFVISYLTGGASGLSASNSATGSEKKEVVASEGNPDKEVFKDTVEGVLRDGGSDEGEGSFHLERPGGDDQTVYLTSSTVDLSKFIGKKVNIMGETFDSQYVGWLMDVGYIEVIR